MNSAINKRQYPAVVGGAGRGAEALTPAFESFNKEAIGAEIVVGYIDPIPGKAEDLAKKAADKGIKAVGGQEHVEDIIFEGNILPPIISIVDRAETIAQVIRNTDESKQTIIGQLLVKTRQDQLWAIRFMMRHKDNIARIQALALFDALGKISEKKGSDAVWGKDGSNEHRMLESSFRQSYAESLSRDLRKVLFHLEPECHPLEICTDGKNNLPLLVYETPKFMEPTALLDHMSEILYFPFGRGDSLAIAEIENQTNIRLHKISRRKNDDRLTLSDLDGTASMTKTDKMQDMIDRYAREQAEEEEARLKARLERKMLSLTQPVITTD